MADGFFEGYFPPCFNLIANLGYFALIYLPSKVLLVFSCFYLGLFICVIVWFVVFIFFLLIMVDGYSHVIHI